VAERITRWADVRCAPESGRIADIGGCRRVTLAVTKRKTQSSARNTRIELAASAKFSFASAILSESILRPNDPQNGFDTAKTQSRPHSDSLGQSGRALEPLPVCCWRGPHHALERCAKGFH
jgi:hypothetical protein